MSKLIQRGAMMCLLTMSAVFMSGGSADAKYRCPTIEICDYYCDFFLKDDGTYEKICYKVCTCH